MPAAAAAAATADDVIAAALQRRFGVHVVEAALAAATSTPVVANSPFDGARKFTWCLRRGLSCVDASVCSPVEGEVGVDLAVLAPAPCTLYCLGAPEVLLAHCSLSSEHRRGLSERLVALGQQGCRVLGLALRPISDLAAVAHPAHVGQGPQAGPDRMDAPSPGAGSMHDAVTALAFASLTFAGLLVFSDPPRPGTAQAVAAARAAGIRCVMVSGDHPSTCVAVAGKVGILGALVSEDGMCWRWRLLMGGMPQQNGAARPSQLRIYVIQRAWRVACLCLCCLCPVMSFP